MKSFSIHSLVFFSALTLAGSAYAGAGIQYRQPLSQPATEPAAKVCTDHHVVPLTVTRPALPNARGPLQVVQVGTQTVCTSCAGTSTVMRPSLLNGKGPMQAVEVTSTRHYCNSSCLPATKN